METLHLNTLTVIIFKAEIEIKLILLNKFTKV